MEVSSIVKCDSCGFTEECTSAYITRIRERYCGLWICGLCVEAVKDEVVRSRSETERLISTEEALNRHINVCKSFQSANFSGSSSSSSKHPLIFAIGKIMRKSLDSPRSGRSSPGGSPSMVRSGSCFLS